mgnify:CR=1 FL=1
MKSPARLLRSLISDIIRLQPGVRGLERDLVTLEKRYQKEGFSFLSKALPALDAQLLAGIESGVFACPRHFKRVPGGSIPRLFSGMICEIFDSVTGVLKEDASVEALTSLHQVLNLFNKAIVDSAESDKLDRIAKDDFIATDASVREEFPQDLMFVARRVASYVLPNLVGNFDRSRHGPGAVYEGARANSKYKHVFDAAIRTSDHQLTDYTTIGILDRIDLSSIPDIDMNGQLSLFSYTEPSGCIARLVTVPKNSTARRTITVEPVLNQFVQQGLRETLLSNIDKCSILSQCLALRRQDLNASLALSSSLDGEYATIDLKSASDLLSNKLVKDLFSSKHDFINEVMRCRTPLVEVDGKVISIKKFAGMGNALTFPIQSVCFAIVAIAGALLYGGKFPTYRNVKRAATRIRIYGDDIITHKTITSSVVQGLQSVGLIVNTKKSFADGDFRESCGVHAYKGVDIVPVYLRTIPLPLGLDHKDLVSLVSTANQLFDRCYYKAAAYIERCVESYLGRLPYVPNDAGVLGWHTRQQHREYHRYNPWLHRYETLVPVATSRKVRDVIDGYPALLKCLTTPLIGRSPGHLEWVPRRYSIRIRPRWVAY